MTKFTNDLKYKRENVWEDSKKDYSNKIFEFSEKYKDFLDNAKTEREFISQAENLAKSKGFVNIDELINNSQNIKEGMKVYRIGYDKTMALAVIGQKPLTDGLNIVGAHVDSPRIDLKPNPLYQSKKLALFKTHYYGGIKKYQWTGVPLALHGTIIKNDGTKLNIVIGENEKDPVFTIADLLPHLAKDQYAKPLSTAISGEELNVLVGSIPEKSSEGDKVKNNVLKLLNEKYGIVEKDFIGAELEIVPAFKAKDIGFDRGMIGAYGQDDRVCAYTCLRAITDVKNPLKTSVCYLSDKEEVGSNGITGAQSNFLKDFMADLLMMDKSIPSNVNKYIGRDDSFRLRTCIKNSKMISADVTAAINPTYPNVHEEMNASNLGDGIVFMKYTGSGGKANSSEANAEYFSEIKRLFDHKNVIWKMADLGKIDQGGGGTITKYAANMGLNVIDCGVGVLGMHSPFEVTSKADVFTSYRAFRKFFKMDNYLDVKKDNSINIPGSVKNKGSSMVTENKSSISKAANYQIS